MESKEHWEQVYSSKPTDRLGWFKPHLQTSVSWIQSLELPADAAILDVGAGASTLVDDLLTQNYESVTVLDISNTALSLLRERLGHDAKKVHWLGADITGVDLPPGHFDLWHDRAVFHFLTEDDQIQRYRQNLVNSLKPRGHSIIGTFAPEAPAKCSGLPVQRYDHELLARTLGDELELLRHHKEMHITPGGVEQMYLYCQFRKR
jgi:SAM-dependent methyltransferase